MKSVVRLSLIFVLLCLASAAAFAQKGNSSEQSVCKNEKLPAGYKIVGESKETSCAEGAWLIRKRGELVYRNDPSARVSSSSSKEEADSDDDDDAAPVRRPKVKPAHNGPTRDEIEEAIRKYTVITGMNMRDVTQAWGSSHSTFVDGEEDETVVIWTYRRGRVFFRDGIVYRVFLLR